MSLRTLHAILFAALALALTLCGSWVALLLTGAQLRQQIGGEMAATAGQVRNILDRSMHGGWRDIGVLATAARTAASTTEARRVWLDAMKASFPAYAWIGFADASGRVTAATGGLLEGANVAERPWFKAGLAAPFAGDLHKALLLERLLPATPDGSPWRFVDVAAPVRDASGAVEGVVGAHLSWAWAGELTRSVMVPYEAGRPGADVIIADSQGTVILGPKAIEGQTLPDAARAWREAGAGDRHAVETWPDGTAYLVGTSRTVGHDDYPGLGWTVMVRQPAEIAFAPARALADKLLVGGSLLALLAALLGLAIGRWVTRPLTSLTEAAGALARSLSSAKALQPSGTTELRALATAFNRMSEAVAERDLSLADSNQQLERRVEERTRELEAMRLTAEQASRAKTDFVAAMSHEIRTPLNGVIGYADILLLDRRLDEGQRRSVERIQGAGNALLTVVNDILDFSKIEAGKVTLAPRPFDLAGLVDQASSIVAISAQAKGLAFIVAIEPGTPPRLVGDDDRLRQVLLNLLNNAIKFTKAGSVRLQVDPLDETREGCTLRFSVEDTGIGIPADKRDRLFQRFSQVDGSVAREFGGTGLGLAISRQLVALMGGAITVESEPGKGSRFAFTVTLGCAEALAPPVREAVEAVVPLRILLAEDVLINQEIARTLLEAAGHRVDVVSDGAAAVRAVQASVYDLVLMDVQMPGMDGLAATRMIRTIPHPAHAIPIVAMTANVLPEEIARFRAHGMDDHLGKPFRRADLDAVLARWAERRDRRAA